MAQQLAACDTCFLLKPVEEYARPDGRWETTCLVSAGGQAAKRAVQSRKGRWPVAIPCMVLWLSGEGGQGASIAPPMVAGLPQQCGTRGKTSTHSGGQWRGGLWCANWGVHCTRENSSGSPALQHRAAAETAATPNLNT